MPVIDTAITVSFQVRNATNGAPITGDAANLTLKIVADGIDATPTNTPVEVALGEYKLALTAGENSGEMMSLIGTSSTTNAVVIPARWQNLDASIGSRATPGNLAAVVATVSLTGGTEVSGNKVTLIRGDTTPLSLTMADNTNIPIDLTAYAAGTFTLTVKPKSNRDDADDTNKIFDVTGTITDAASGIVLFNISAADTELLSRGEYYDFDVQYDSGDGAIIKTFIVGEIKLQYDVTRTSSV